MPDRSYQPHNPPTWGDRLLHHPFEVALAAWWAMCGLVLTGSLLAGEIASASLSRLPLGIVAVATVTIGTGGALVLLALLRRWRLVTTAWWVERLGLSLAASGWLIYAAAVLVPYPQSVVSWSLGLAMGGSAALRLVASFFIEVATRKAIKRTGI